jgi:hypothetical protein
MTFSSAVAGNTTTSIWNFNITDLYCPNGDKVNFGRQCTHEVRVGSQVVAVGNSKTPISFAGMSREKIKALIAILESDDTRLPTSTDRDAYAALVSANKHAPAELAPGTLVTCNLEIVTTKKTAPIPLTEEYAPLSGKETPGKRPLISNIITRLFRSSSARPNENKVCWTMQNYLPEERAQAVRALLSDERRETLLAMGRRYDQQTCAAADVPASLPAGRLASEPEKRSRFSAFMGAVKRIFTKNDGLSRRASSVLVYNVQAARLAHLANTAAHNTPQASPAHSCSHRSEPVPAHADEHRTSCAGEPCFSDSDGEWDDGESLILDGRFWRADSISEDAIYRSNSKDMTARSDGAESTATLPESSHFVRGANARATLHGNHASLAEVISQEFEERAIDVPDWMAATLTPRPQIPKKPEGIVLKRRNVSLPSVNSSPVTSDGEVSPSVQQGTALWENYHPVRARPRQASPEPINNEPLRQIYSSFSGSGDSLHETGNLLTRRMEAMNEALGRRLRRHQEK